jgi:uncharacterized protein (DUF1501 family)
MRQGFESPGRVCTSAPSRRQFLSVSAAGAGLSAAWHLSPASAADQGINGRARHCILLFLVGGPSQLDTWDPKPCAPVEVRGPFRPIRTTVPGTQICETFPRMAARADQFAIVRSLYHREAAVHETGHQLMQTGHVTRHGFEYPHLGAVISSLGGESASGAPPFVVVPGPIKNTGMAIGHGQIAGFLGREHAPRFSRPLSVKAGECANENSEEIPASAQVDASVPLSTCDISREPHRTRDLYGSSPFGASCLLARRLVERGTRVVTVNMYDTLYNRVTWDCHADSRTLPTTLNDYRDSVCPAFDWAFTGLLEDLRQHGLLEETLVVAMGEFGRTPRLNASGGRDHWPGVWSILFAGGLVRGGHVIGASDRIGSEPSERPVTPAEVVATIFHALGINLDSMLRARDGRIFPLTSAQPITELF